MVTGNGLPAGLLGAVKLPVKVEVEPGPFFRVKGPVFTPLTCTVRCEMSLEVSTCAAKGC